MDRLLAELMLEYGWDLDQTLDKIEPAQVGFLLDQARGRRHRHNLELLRVFHTSDPAKLASELDSNMTHALGRQEQQQVKPDFNEGLAKLALASSRPQVAAKIRLHERARALMKGMGFLRDKSNV